MRKYLKWIAGGFALLCAFGLGRGDDLYSEADLLKAQEEAYNKGYYAGVEENAEVDVVGQDALYTQAFSEGQQAGYDLGLAEGIAQGSAQREQTVLSAAGDTYQQGYDLGYADGYAQKAKDELAQRDQYVASLQTTLAALESTPPASDILPIVTPADEPAVPVEEPTHTQVVYVTKSGTKYHLGSCSHLSKSKIEKPLTEAKSAGYTPCKTCKPPQ